MSAEQVVDRVACGEVLGLGHGPRTGAPADRPTENDADTLRVERTCWSMRSAPPCDAVGPGSRSHSPSTTSPTARNTLSSICLPPCPIGRVGLALSTPAIGDTEQSCADAVGGQSNVLRRRSVGTESARHESRAGLVLT